MICKLDKLYLENSFKIISSLRLGKTRFFVKVGENQTDTYEVAYKPNKAEMQVLRNQDVEWLTNLDGSISAKFVDEQECLDIIERPRVVREYCY